MLNYSITYFSSSQYAFDKYDTEQKLRAKYEMLRAIYKATLNDPNKAIELLKNKDNPRCKIVRQFHKDYLKLIVGRNFELSNKFTKNSTVIELFGIPV